MAENVGALARSFIQRGIAEGLSYNDLYHQLSAEQGVSMRSGEFAREYRFAQGLAASETPLSAATRGVVPTADVITQSTIAWPDRFVARVKLSGRDLESGRFSNRWVTIGYDRLPSLGTIADTAMTMAMLGDEHYDFETRGVSSVTVEQSAGWLGAA